jgi:hypothetical protein
MRALEVFFQAVFEWSVMDDFLKPGDGGGNLLEIPLVILVVA